MAEGSIESKYDFIILDIEGTIAPISFVTETLFPYARAHIESFLNSNWTDAETQEAVSALVALNAEDRQGAFLEAPLLEVSDNYASTDEFKSAVIAYVGWLMSLDRKVTPLKSLQGLIWANGFKSGIIKGQIYTDAKNAMERWVLQGKKLYIYSSGSVAAQKLLVTYSEHGNLSSLLSGYFDTTIGGKREESSYSRILSQIGSLPERTLFLTDIVQERDAAIASGMHCLIVDRSEHPEPSTITTFDELTT